MRDITPASWNFPEIRVGKFTHLQDIFRLTHFPMTAVPLGNTSFAVLLITSYCLIPPVSGEMTRYSNSKRVKGIFKCIVGKLAATLNERFTCLSLGTRIALFYTCFVHESYELNFSKTKIIQLLFSKMFVLYIPREGIRHPPVKLTTVIF